MNFEQSWGDRFRYLYYHSIILPFITKISVLAYKKFLRRLLLGMLLLTSVCAAVAIIVFLVMAFQYLREGHPAALLITLFVIISYLIGIGLEKEIQKDRDN